MPELVIRVVVDAASLSVTASNAVVGSIWLDLDGEAFPSAEWADFPVVILGWWGEAVDDLSTRRSSRASLAFMEGPYLCKLTYHADDTVSVKLVRRRTSGSEVISAHETRLSAFAEEIRNAVNVVRRWCRDHGYNSPDLVMLDRIARGQEKGSEAE